MTARTTIATEEQMDAPGRSLDDVMAEGVADAEAYAILRAVARAIDAMHAEGRVHGALRPQSIELGSGTSARITDWVAGRHEAGLEEVADAVEYLAPERLAGAAADPAADQFSFALIAYRMLLGRSPFAAKGLAEMLFLMRYGIPGSDAQEYVNFATQGVFDRALAADPAHRFASCLELVEALERIPRQSYSETRLLETDEQPPISASLSAEASRQRTVRSNSSRLWWGAAAVLSLAAFGLGAANWQAQRELDTMAAQSAELASHAEQENPRNGQLKVCNTSSEPLQIRELAAAYMDTASKLRVFNSAEHIREGWSVAPGQAQLLSWRVGSAADWDGSVLFYFLKLERNRKEYVIAGKWNGTAQGCLHVGL
jgi:serine/threonine protein kinase